MEPGNNHVDAAGISENSAHETKLESFNAAISSIEIENNKPSEKVDFGGGQRPRKLTRKPGEKRGRKPKKSPEKTPNFDLHGGAAVDNSTPNFTAAQPPMPEMDFKPLLKNGLKMPFKMWSKKTGCKDLELSDSEAEAPLEYANVMLNYYAPRMESMDPGKTALVMFGISMLMIYGEKQAALDAFLEEKLKIHGSTTAVFEEKMPTEPQFQNSTAKVNEHSYLLPRGLSN